MKDAMMAKVTTRLASCASLATVSVPMSRPAANPQLAASPGGGVKDREFFRCSEYRQAAAVHGAEEKPAYHHHAEGHDGERVPRREIEEQRARDDGGEEAKRARVEH